MKEKERFYDQGKAFLEVASDNARTAYGLTTDVYAISEQIAEQKEAMRLIVARISQQVANETTEEGKKIYSNADSRGAETKARVSLDTEHIELSDGLKKMEEAKVYREAEVEYNKRMMRINIAQAELITAFVRG